MKECWLDRPRDHLSVCQAVQADAHDLTVKDAWNVPILGDPFAFFLDRCK